MRIDCTHNNIVVVGESEYPIISPVLFDINGNYNPEVLGIHSSFGRPFYIMFNNHENMMHFWELAQEAIKSKI